MSAQINKTTKGLVRHRFCGPNRKNGAGFLALTTAIIMSVSLLVLVIAVGFQGYFSRYGVLETDYKERSIYLAEACARTTMLKIAQDTDYAGNEAGIHVGDATCDIGGVTGAGKTRTIEARADYKDAVTNLVVEIDISTLPSVTINSWEEVASF